MADISQVTLLDGNTYNIKDAAARQSISDIQTSISGGVRLVGETTTVLTEGATAKPIKINNVDYNQINGDLVYYGKKEFLWNGTIWTEMGDLSSLGALGTKDSATANYKPQGTVSQPTFTGTASAVTITTADSASGNYQPKGSVSKPTFTGSTSTATGKFTPSGTVSVSTNTTANQTATVAPASSGTVTYTPAGSVAAPTISVKTAGGTTTVNSITAVGTLPELTTTVSGEVLTIAFNKGTLPTKGANTTVKTGDAAYEATAPAFTGTGVRLVTGNISVPSSYTASFTGTEDDVNVSGTPNGSVSQPSFTGTKAQISGSVTPSGTVSQPTFTGTQTTITVT